MGEEKLTIRAEAEGFGEAAKKIDGVSEAEDRLKGKVQETGAASEETRKATENLTASEGDYVSLLSQINPTIGAFADGILKASKIAGDAAGQNINLAATFAKLREAIKANASALKLLGAASAVAAGIWLIVRAVEAEREARERLATAIKTQSDAMNELKGEERDRQVEIERIADTRREGGFDADTSRRVAAAAGRAKKQYGQLDEAAINEAFGLLGDTGMSQEELVNAAILQMQGRLRVEAEAPAAVRAQQARAATEHYAGQIAMFTERETQQGWGMGRGPRPPGPTEQEQAAQQEMTSEGGSDINLRRELEKYLPPGSDIDKAIRLIRATGGDVGSKEIGFASLRPLTTAANRARGLVEFDVEAPGGGYETLGRDEYESLQAALRNMERSRRQGEDRVDITQFATFMSSPMETGALAGRQPVVIHNHYNQQNSRVMYPDAASQKRATRNGEMLRESVEAG